MSNCASANVGSLSWASDPLSYQWGRSRVGTCFSGVSGVLQVELRCVLPLVCVPVRRPALSGVALRPSPDLRLDCQLVYIYCKAFTSQGVVGHLGHQAI